MKVDGTGKPRENPENRFRLDKLAVRNGDAFADSCRSQTLALEQDIKDFPRCKAREQPRAVAQLLKRVFLRVHLERGDNRVGGDQFS